MRNKAAVICGVVSGILCAFIAAAAAYSTLHFSGYIVGAVSHDETFTDIFMQFAEVDITLPWWGMIAVFAIGGMCGYLPRRKGRSGKLYPKVIGILFAVVAVIAGYALCLWFAEVKGVPVSLLVRIVRNILNSGII